MADDFEILRFGNEAEPLVVIDDFFSDLTLLRRMAARSEFGVTSPHYPGVRAQADPNYLGERMDTLRAVLTDVFGLGQGANMVECAFSIVTTKPTDLKPIQRLPHFDTTDPKRLLCCIISVLMRRAGRPFIDTKRLDSRLYRLTV